jgi:hypothetical protein
MIRVDQDIRHGWIPSQVAKAIRVALNIERIGQSPYDLRSRARPPSMAGRIGPSSQPITARTDGHQCGALRTNPE